MESREVRAFVVPGMKKMVNMTSVANKQRQVQFMRFTFLLIPALKQWRMPDEAVRE